MLPEITYKGETFKLGCNLPASYPLGLPLASEVLRIPAWSKQEIISAIEVKPFKKRNILTGKDWILNQGQLGSCNCAALAGTMRRTMWLGGRNDIPQLSWEFAYAQLVDGNDEGSQLADAVILGLNVGLPPLDLQKHPLNRDYSKRDYSQAEMEQAKSFRYEKAFFCETSEELATVILSGLGAGVVAVHVGGNFTNLDRNGICGVDNGPGNHAVCIDDVEVINGELVFDMPNSWGLSFGENGRGYLREAHLLQTRPYHRHYGVTASTNPNAPIPPISQ